MPILPIASKKRRGRPADPKRTVVNILSRQGGKRTHMFSFTIRCEPGDVHKTLYERFAGLIVH